MKHNPVQPSFGAGEVSPLMLGRVDIAKYAIGLARQKNFITLPQGGTRFRSGTKYVYGIKNNATGAYLFPFQYSTTQAYALELGNLYVRFYANHGIVISGGVPYEIVSPYAISDIPNICMTQSADTLYICHPNYRPKKLLRLGPTNWQFVDLNYTDGPYLPINTDSTKTLTPSGTSGSVTIIANYSAFVATDIGRMIRIKQGSTWGCAQITAYTNSTTVTAATQSGYSFSATTATSTFRLGAWSDTTGWPSVVCFHQQRLGFANTRSNPQTAWLSYSGDFERFSPSETDNSVNDSCAVTFTIASNKVNAILWMVTSRVLVIGTTGAEWVVNGSNGTYSTITPTSIQVTQQTTYGTKFIPGTNILSATIWVQRGGNRLVETFYNFGTDSYLGKDLSLISQHLLLDGGGAISMVYQQEPDSTIWLLRADGILIGVTYIKEQEMVAWHQHQIGGSFNGGHAVVESFCPMPTPDGQSDELWLQVKRTINGQTVRYIEYLDQPFRATDPNTKTGMHFVDCGAVYNGSPATVISGLDYLEGETVTVNYDGAVHPDLVVSSGSITLRRAASEVHVGYAYEGQVRTLRPDGGGNFGTSQGKVRNYNKLIIRLDNTLGGKFGKDESTLTDFVFRENTDLLGQSPPLFTGDKKVDLDGTYDLDGSIWIVQDKPYPMTILAIMMEGVVYG